MLRAMGGDPGAPPPAEAQTRFSADGFWWWDGSEWKPALSQDRLWRWNGQSWEPAGRGGVPAPSGGPGAGPPIRITRAILPGLVVPVGLIPAGVLPTMAKHIP